MADIQTQKREITTLDPGGQYVEPSTLALATSLEPTQEELAALVRFRAICFSPGSPDEPGELEEVLDLVSENSGCRLDSTGDFTT